MANIDRPAGFKPVGHINGHPWNGKANMYYIPSTDSTAVFMGDAVKTAGSADSTGKYPTVTQATATHPIRGVAIGFSDQPYVSFDTSDLNRKYRPASTAMYVLVVDDPGVIFEIQEDNDTEDMEALDVGATCDIIVGNGDTDNGMSGMELDSSDGGSTSSQQCLVLRVTNREDNALGDYCKWDVLINDHELSSATAGI